MEVPPSFFLFRAFLIPSFHHSSQCSLLVGGAWGFFYFKEMSGWRKTTQYFVCGVGLIGAAYMLSYFGRDTTDSTSNC